MKIQEGESRIHSEIPSEPFSDVRFRVNVPSIDRCGAGNHLAEKFAEMNLSSETAGGKFVSSEQTFGARTRWNRGAPGDSVARRCNN